MKSSPQLVRETLLQILLPERRGSDLRDVPASPTTRKSVVRASSAQVRGDLFCRSVILSLVVVVGSNPESGAFGKRSLE